MDSAWERAVREGDVEAVRDLVRSGVNVDARDRHGQTAVMLAAHNGHREIVEILIGSDADLDVTAKYNLTALMLAIVAGHAAIACLLVRAGADVTVMGSGAPGFAAKTAYDLAAARGMDDVCLELSRR